MHRFEWILENTEGSIIDIGCGHSKYYRNPEGTHIETERKYLGIDIYHEPDWSGPGVPENFVVADAEYIPVADGSFHTATVGAVLEHTVNPIEVFKEAIRVASDRVILTVTHEDGWPCDLDFSNVKYGNPKHTFSKEKLLYYCELADVDKDNVSISHTEDFPLAYWLVRVDLNE